MRVLVTGASSNLGTFVLPALCEAGYDPVAVVHSGDVDDRYASIRCDLSRPLPESVTAQTWDGIVHLASSGAQTHQEILDIDITAMHQLLAQWTRGPFVYCSSQTVYGVPQGVLSEEHPLDPVTPYDWGKVAASQGNWVAGQWASDWIVMWPQPIGEDPTVSRYDDRGAHGATQVCLSE